LKSSQDEQRKKLEELQMQLDLEKMNIDLILMEQEEARQARVAAEDQQRQKEVALVKLLLT
jgi:hypothetical protein